MGVEEIFIKSISHDILWFYSSWLVNTKIMNWFQFIETKQKQQQRFFKLHGDDIDE